MSDTDPTINSLTDYLPEIFSQIGSNEIRSNDMVALEFGLLQHLINKYTFF